MQQDDSGWSPYLAGALSGAVGVFSVWFAGKYFGASTSFVRTAALIEQFFSPERAARMEYFIKVTPKIDWLPCSFSDGWKKCNCEGSGSGSIVEI